MSNNSGQFSEDSEFAAYFSGLVDASWENNDDGIPEVLKKI
jgi:hypothetical protein